MARGWELHPQMLVPAFGGNRRAACAQFHCTSQRVGWGLALWMVRQVSEIVPLVPGHLRDLQRLHEGLLLCGSAGGSAVSSSLLLRGAGDPASRRAKAS
eukprot:8337242-Alexandrium_andersonii.AAC.1